MNTLPKKSNEKSKFYIQSTPTSIYVSSISHDPNEMNQMEDTELKDRCKSSSNINEQKATNQNSNHAHYTGTMSKIRNFFHKNNPKKSMDHSLSVQENLSGREKSMETIHSLIFSTETSSVVKIPPSPRNTLVLDEKTRADIYIKLKNLSDDEKIELQKKSLALLKKQVESRKKENIELQKSINEFRTDLETKRQPLRSRNEIENLKAEIRNLTNEKADLELKISQTYRWKCWRCTYENKNENSQCEMCGTERASNEFIICKFCAQKNSLSSMSCQACNNYIDENQAEDANSRVRQSSSNSSNSNPSVTKLHSGSSLSPDVGVIKSSPYSSPNISSRPNCFRTGNYNSQTSSSSNNSVFMPPTPQSFDNPVYFNLSSSNLSDENRYLSPSHPNPYGNLTQENNQPNIPVVIDDDFKRKNNRKKKFF